MGGGGWLGGAIAERGLAAGVLSEASLIVSGRSPKGNRFSRWPRVAWTSDNSELARRSEIVVLSVRPEQFGDLRLDLSGKLVVSVMAGVSVATLSRETGADRVVRTMPNAAAGTGRSYTPWLASAKASDADRAFVRRLFDCCGEEDAVDSEQALDFLTGLSGTGPAYPALLAKAMIDCATRAGISEHVAIRAARGVVCGAAALMDGEAFDPAATVKTFTDYRGVTAAGLDAMTGAGLTAAVGAGARGSGGCRRRHGREICVKVGDRRARDAIDARRVGCLPMAFAATRGFSWSPMATARDRSGCTGSCSLSSPSSSSWATT